MKTKVQCSTLCCSNVAEVTCDCQENVFLCSTHGYEHFINTDHELNDIDKSESDFKFLDIDLCLLKGKPIKSIDINEGTSLFRKLLLKYLKRIHPSRHKKFGITENLKKYLFSVKYKVPCFACEKGVSYIKLHLVTKHHMNEEARKEYWQSYIDKYSNMGIQFRDII